MSFPMFIKMTPAKFHIEKKIYIRILEEFSMSNIHTLAEEITNNPEKIADLTPEQVDELLKESNPYGMTLNVAESYGLFSITNLREKYITRFTTTAMIGYLFRLMEEYKMELTDEQLDQKKVLPAEEWHKLVAEAEANHAKEKEIVRRFLCRNFRYDPNKHAVAAYKENMDDPERYKRFDAFKRNMENGRNEQAVKEDLATNPTKYEADLKDKILFTNEALNDIIDTTQKVLNVLGDESSFEPVANILRAKKQELVAQKEHLTPTVRALADPDVTHAYAIVPPADCFHNFNRYRASHYEQLREVVDVLYVEKPDLDFMIQFMGSRSTLEEAKKFQAENENSINTAIDIVESGQWTFLGPFKQNRERAEFYNKHTEVLKKIHEQHISDEKMGERMMKERVKREKTRNIRADGLDADGLALYKETTNTIDTLGAKTELTEKEKREIYEAQRRLQQLKEDAAVPDDAVQVDVYKVDETGDFKRSIFYTAADTPMTQDELQKARLEQLTQSTKKSKDVEALRKDLF